MRGRWWVALGVASLAALGVGFAAAYGNEAYGDTMPEDIFRWG